MIFLEESISLCPECGLEYKRTLFNSFPVILRSFLSDLDMK